MIHKLHIPGPPLSQFVENMWLVEGFSADYTREKILPDGAIELIIDLDTQPKTIFEDEGSESVPNGQEGLDLGRENSLPCHRRNSEPINGWHSFPARRRLPLLRLSHF